MNKKGKPIWDRRVLIEDELLAILVYMGLREVYLSAGGQMVPERRSAVLRTACGSLLLSG